MNLFLQKEVLFFMQHELNTGGNENTVRAAPAVSFVYSSFRPLKKIVLWRGFLFVLLVHFILLVFGGKLLAHIPGLSLNDGSYMFTSSSLTWFCLLLLWLYAMEVEKHPLLIWEEKKLKPYVYLLSIVVLYVILIFGLGCISTILTKLGLYKESPRLYRLMHMFGHNHLVIIFTALSAGITEELTFRGYIMPRLILATKSPFAGILVSSLLFGLVHFGYGTLMNMVGPFFIGLISACFYYVYRNIRVVIILHFLWDLIIFYILIYYKKH